MLTGHRPYYLDFGDLEGLVEAVCRRQPPRPSSVVGRTTSVNWSGKSRDLDPESVASLRSDQPRALARRLAGDLDHVVARALAKDPGDRYPSVQQLADDLARYLEGRPVKARRGNVWVPKSQVRRASLARSHSGIVIPRRPLGSPGGSLVSAGRDPARAQPGAGDLGSAVGSLRNTRSIACPWRDHYSAATLGRRDGSGR